MNLTDEQCTILTLRGQVTDLEGERDRALKRVEELEENLRKAGAEIGQMASEWYADHERVKQAEARASVDNRILAAAKAWWESRTKPNGPRGSELHAACAARWGQQ